MLQSNLNNQSESSSFYLFYCHCIAALFVAGITATFLMNILIVNPWTWQWHYVSQEPLAFLTVFSSDQDDLQCGFLILTLVHFVSIETCRGKYGNE